MNFASLDFDMTFIWKATLSCYEALDEIGLEDTILAYGFILD